MSEATSFTASFRVPFERADVFREISKAQAPLGIDTKRVNIKVTKDSKLIELIQVGCSREAEFVDNTGTTTSKLVALEDGKRVVWEELSSTVQSMRMVGIEGQPPLFTTLLTDDPRGTHVELRYDFHSVQLPGLFGNSVSKTAFPSHISDSLPEAVRRALITRRHAVTCLAPVSSIARPFCACMPFSPTRGSSAAASIPVIAGSSAVASISLTAYERLSIMATPAPLALSGAFRMGRRHAVPRLSETHD